MKKTRITPDALNNPLEILGLQRVVFLSVVSLGILIGNKYGLIPGVIAFLALYCGLVVLHRRDRDWFELLPACFRFQLDRAYDPCEREYFQLVIVEDSNEEED
jgi:hypothetical protein